MSIRRISCRDQIPVLNDKRFADTSTVHEIASLLEQAHRFVFDILGVSPVVVTQAPERQIIASAFQSFCQACEFSSIEHTSPCFRIDRPCQHKYSMADSANDFVVFEKFQGLVLNCIALQILSHTPGMTTGQEQ